MAGNGPEIHPAVEAGSPHRQRNAEAFSEATQKAIASVGALSQVYKRKERRKATLAMLLRVAVAIALVALVVVLRQYDHVSAEVTLVSILLLDAWAAAWVGAWAQKMWGRWEAWY